MAVACAALAAVAAGVAAHRYGQNLWQVEQTLIYVPTPVPDAIRADYAPSTPQTAVELMKSSATLEAVVRDLQLPVSGRTLDRSLKVTKPQNSDAVSVVLDWPDPAVGRAVVEHLSEVHAREMADLRRRKADQRAVALGAEREACRAAVDRARRAYTHLRPGEAPGAARAEWDVVAKESAGLALDRAVTREKLDQCRAAIARCEAREKAAAGRRGGTDPEEATAPYRQRKEAVRDALAAEESRLAEVDSQLAAQVRESDRFLRLSSGAVTLLEIDRAKAAVDLLKVKQANARRVVEDRRRELTELPVQQARADRAALDEQRVGLEARAAALDREQADKRREAARLAAVIAQEAALAARTDRAEADLRAVDARIAALDRLAAEGGGELIPARPPAASAAPTSSNRKSIGVMVFAGVTGAGLLGLVGHARLTTPRSPERATVGGFPVLAAVEPGADECRRLAARLRGPVRQGGGLVLFTPTEDAVPTDDLVDYLARCLAVGRESVLILDARVTPPLADPTLVHLEAADDDSTFALFGGGGDPVAPPSVVMRFIQSKGEDDEAFVHETASAGVHHCQLSALFPTPDLVTTKLMQRLLVRLTGRFDRILVLGPPLTRAAEVEVLAGYADGAVVVARPGGAADPAGVEALTAAGLPWVGTVTRS